MDWAAPILQRRGLVVGMAALLPLVASAVLAELRETVTVATSVLLLALIIVAAAATGDRVAGLVAALSSGAWFDFFLTEPYYRFTIADEEDIEITVLLVLIGVAVTEVALWGRRQQARASRRAGYLDGVLNTAEIISASEEPPDVLIDRVSAQIEAVLGIEGCRFVHGPVRDTRLAILDHDGIVTRGGHRIRVERDGLPSDEESALLVRRGGEVEGHFVLTAASRIARPSLEQRRVAVLLADQVAAALDDTTR
jgi:K+-sensing histidine kinase KdpD